MTPPSRFWYTHGNVSVPVRVPERVGWGWWGWVGVAGFVVMAGAQIAIPLSDDRDVLTTVVIGGFAVASFAAGAATWGGPRTLAGTLYVLTLTLALERVGSTTGIPFGAYRYTGVLEPAIRDVPVAVPLAWFAMALPALEIGRRLGRRWIERAAIGAVALTAWDLFLDPQMVDEGYWRWAVDGFYRGIPLSNYLGWLLSSFVVLGALDRLLGRAARSDALLALYSWWAAMSTVGFLFFFGDVVVAIVGGAAMIPLAVAAWRRA